MAETERRTAAGLFPRRLSSRDLALLTRQIATLLRSGVPLEEALQTTAAQTAKPWLRRVVSDIRSQVLEGKSFSASLAAYPQHFSGLYRATVSAGEAAGRLDTVLQSLVEHVERQEALRRKVQIALIYPVLLLIVSSLVVLGLVTYVVPEIASVFASTGQRLPALTRLLIATSGFLKSNGGLLAAGLLALLVLARLLLHSGTMRERLHRSLLALPLVAPFLRTRYAGRMTRTLAILLGSGVPLLDSLAIAAGIIESLPVQRSVREAAMRVREGEPLNRALARGGHFPPVTLNLIACGEAGGNLAEMLASAADDLDRETTVYVETFLALFEPLLILTMGGVVLAIVLAILLPIFEMNQLVG